MKIELIAHETGDLLPIILDADGMPIPTPNEFLISRRHFSPNTLMRNARDLVIFYGWMEKNGIDLDSKIAGKFGFTEAEIRGSLSESMKRHQSQNKKVIKLAVHPETFNQRMLTVRQFLLWYCGVLGGMVPTASIEDERVSNSKNRLLNFLNDSFMSSVPSNKKEKSLNYKELASLVSLLESEDSGICGANEGVSCRNSIIIMIMLYYGLRPSELLSLRVEDVEFGAISCLRVVRRPPDVNDLRRPRPQIKRNGRVLPIDDPIFAEKLDEYITKWRDLFSTNAREDSEYLILSNTGVPLSHSSVTQFYQLFRKKYSQVLPSYFSPKISRHVFSEQMEDCLRESGMDEDKRRQALAYLRGDSSLSSQDVYLAREIERQSHKALRRFQQHLIQERMPF